MMSFAGVDLCASTPEVDAWIATNLPTDDVLEFPGRYLPGVGLDGVPFRPAWRASCPVVPGRLFWPWGASRFAYGHFLTTSGDDLDAIRAVVYPTTTTVTTGDLVLDGDDGVSVTAPMWMLPPRPLGQVGSETGLWLLTLVDHRYYWWQGASNITAQSTWANLYSAIGTALGITITPATVDTDYLTPPADLLGRYVALPLLLDGVAACVGQRVVRAFDGAVTTQNAGTARTAWEASRSTYSTRILAGGTILL